MQKTKFWFNKNKFWLLNLDYYTQKKMTFASKSEMKKNRITNTLIDQKSFMRLNNHQTNKHLIVRRTFSDTTHTPKKKNP